MTARFADTIRTHSPESETEEEEDPRSCKEIVKDMWKRIKGGGKDKK